MFDVSQASFCLLVIVLVSVTGQIRVIFASISWLWLSCFLFLEIFYHKSRISPRWFIGQVREVTTSDGSSGRSRKLNGAADIHREEVNEIKEEEEEEHKEEQRSASAKGRSVSTESVYSNNHHPCNLVRLAKVAFLKCLGLWWWW